MKVDTKELVDLGEIARIANVSGSAVNNWIQRYEDFPRSVWHSDVNPRFRLYLRYQVVAWLVHHGKD